MSERPELCAGLDADTFRSYYYLKPANKKSSPKADLTEGKFAGSR